MPGDPSFYGALPPNVEAQFRKDDRNGRKWIEDQDKDAELALDAEERSEGYKHWVGERRVEARKVYANKIPEPYDTDGADPVNDWSFVAKVHEWMDHALPIENDMAARQRYQASMKIYSPPGLFGDVGIVALFGLAATIGLLWWWIRWNTNRLFYADLDSPQAGPMSQEQC